MVTHRRRLLLLAFAVFDLLLLALLAGLFLAGSEFSGDDAFIEPGIARFEDPVLLQDFLLTDQQGRVFSRDDLKGKWQFVFFGFTSCPDICPYAMQALETFYRGLESDRLRSETGVIMVSVDPLHDSPEVMADFVGALHPDFVGLTGEYPQIAALAKQLFFAFSRPVEQAGGTGGNYTVQHSDHIGVVDPGRSLSRYSPRSTHRRKACSGLWVIQRLTDSWGQV